MALTTPAINAMGDDAAALDAKLAFTLGRMVIASGSTFFAVFFFSFGVLHIFNDNNRWLPHGVTLPNLAIGIASPALLILSGLVYLLGQDSLRRLNGGIRFSGYALVAVLLALAAVAFYGASLRHLSFGEHSGGYASVFFALTRVYATVAFCVTLFMAALGVRARRGLYPLGRTAPVDAFGEVWGWTIAVGFAAFLVLYVVPFLPIA